MERSYVSLVCRTSDRSPTGAAGAAALGELVGARVIGSPGEPRDGRWDDDLRDSRGCLLEAGGQIDDALGAGKVPVLFSSDCSVCITTMPTVLRHRPDAWFLWLDAHGDFNTPDTTPSGFLGGMCLAAACGVWDAGLAKDVDLPDLDPSRIVMHGVRDLDGGERVLLETHGVGSVSDPDQLVDLLAARPVFIHLDCDVLDPDVMPATFPAPGGLDFDQLGDLIADLVLAAEAEVLGAEVTSVSPDHASAIHEAILPLLEPAP